MIAQNKHWYVQRRGELAAQQFLLELGATFVSLEQEAGFRFDYMACFGKEDGTIVVVGVEVKATQTDIDGKFPMSSDQIEQLLKINIPILIVVVNVKENNLYFNWIKEAVPIVSGKHMQKVNLRTATPEERERLRLEIQSIQ